MREGLVGSVTSVGTGWDAVTAERYDAFSRLTTMTGDSSKLVAHLAQVPHGVADLGCTAVCAAPVLELLEPQGRMHGIDACSAEMLAFAGVGCSTLGSCGRGQGLGAADRGRAA